MTLSSVGSRIAFYPSLFYNIVLNKVGSREWYNRIDETVILGAMPVKWLADDIMQTENIGGVLSLNEEFELNYLVYTPEEWGSFGVEQLKVPTVDFIGAPSENDIRKGIEFITQQRERNKSVYVHCKAGRTRSTTMVTCYLMHKNGWTPEKAIHFIKEKRPHVVLRQPHYNIIEKYYTSLNDLRKE